MSDNDNSAGTPRRSWAIAAVLVGLVLVVAVWGNTAQAPQPEEPSTTTADAEPLPRDQPSDRCLDAMRTAAAETDSERANPRILATLTACDTEEEWYTALRRHPGAMGLTRVPAGDTIAIESACYGEGHRPVCTDAGIDQ